MEQDTQTIAPLIVEAGKVKKPALPTSDLERTTFGLRAARRSPRTSDAGTLAKTFRQVSKVEPAISRVLASLAR